jgi:thiamine biosynthesis lipoprotein
VTATTAFALWGGRAEVAVADPDALDTALAAVRQTVEEFDAACSTFREDSEIAALHRHGGRPFAAGPALLDAVGAALRGARESGGTVDPTVGLALVAHRAGSEFAFEPVPGWLTVSLDHATHTITLAEGIRLDLGATGKALAADRAAARAHEATGCGVLVNLLGDLSLAGPAPAGGWAVRVTDDHRAGFAAPGQTVALRDGALATSSTVPRGEHLIDPATGRPADTDLRTVSVVAGTCVDANVAATAALIRGSAGLPWLAETGLAARLVATNGTVMTLGGWPA